MPTHPTSIHPPSSRRDAEMLGCSPGGTPGWRGVPCSPIPCPSIPCSLGGVLDGGGVPCPSIACSPRGTPGWGWGATPTHPISIQPLFSRRDVGMEMGCRVHPSHVLQEVHQDGEGSHAHPSLAHPSHALCAGCWDGDGVPCPPIPLPSISRPPGGMLGRRRGTTSVSHVLKEGGGE